MESSTSNFAFLSAHDAQLVKLGALVERYFAKDPVTAIFKLRQFAERSSNTNLPASFWTASATNAVPPPSRLLNAIARHRSDT